MIFTSAERSDADAEFRLESTTVWGITTGGGAVAGVCAATITGPASFFGVAGSCGARELVVVSTTDGASVAVSDTAIGDFVSLGTT